MQGTVSGTGLLDSEEINDSKIIVLMCLTLVPHTAAVNTAEEEAPPVLWTTIAQGRRSQRSVAGCCFGTSPVSARRLRPVAFDLP